jgi:glycosyltransferase involved in cell wall biosynthesis
LWNNRKKIREGTGGHEYIKDALKRLRNNVIIEQGLKEYGKGCKVIFDTRKLSFADLVDLYNSAHCFVLPTYGEGWGLTLCEAMATGAPCISGSYTGTKDFFDDSVGYTTKYDIKPCDLQNYDLTTVGFVPDTVDVINKMIHVFSHYAEALKLGKKASSRIHNKFTWEKSGRRLAEIIKGWQDEHNH